MIQELNDSQPEEQKPEVGQEPSEKNLEPENQVAEQSVEKDKEKEDLPKRTVLVRYGKVGLIGQFRHNERTIPSIKTHVVVQTDRGLEMGEVISPSGAHRGCTCVIPKENIDKYIKDSGPDYPFSRNGKVVRLATVQDLNEYRHIEENAINEGKRCKELIKKLNLEMKIVEIEHLFGGDRIIYYFMAEGRIDFRELVKQLAKEFNTRIEMRQVGARDEAMLVGDYDTCGQELCCKRFLKVLQPVSMRMAKVQRTTLDPAKISGRCGRLKCCLRYENVGYEELQKRLPKNNTMVLSELGHGRVVDSMVLTQLVKIRLEETGRMVAVNVEELLDRNYKPTEEELKRQKEIQAKKEAKQQQRERKQQQADEKADQRKNARDNQGRKDQRQKDPRQRDQKNKDNEQKKDDQSSPQAQQGQEGQEGAPKKKRRRRRRRRKKTDGGGENSGGSDNPSPPSE